MEDVDLTLRKHVHGYEKDDVAVILREKLTEMVPLRDPESYLCKEERNVFHVLYRFENHRVGKPAYPEPETWDTVASYLGVMVPLQSIGVTPPGHPQPQFENPQTVAEAEGILKEAA